MVLNKEDTVVLKILVQKELQMLEEDGEKVMISNSPFLNKVALDDSDVEFLKGAEEYKEFLVELEKKL